MIGTVVGGYRITEAFAEGTRSVYRGLGPAGERAIMTVASPPTPDDVTRKLALPLEGSLPLRRVEATTEHERPASAVIETEPRGYLIGDLKWPLPIDEVITVSLDLARLLSRMHAAGAVHGSLRPQTTWI